MDDSDLTEIRDDLDDLGDRLDQLEALLGEQVLFWSRAQFFVLVAALAYFIHWHELLAHFR